MKEDPVIQRVREARHRISERFGHDPEKLVAYYMKRQKEHAGQLIETPEQSQERSSLKET